MSNAVRRLFSSQSSLALETSAQMAAPFGGFQNANAGWVLPAAGATTAAGGQMPQGASQICNACGYAMPSSRSSTERNIPCKQCGYTGFPNEPQPQRMVPLQQLELERNRAVPLTVTQAPVHQAPLQPSTNAPVPVFQPIQHSTPIAKPRLPPQQDGRGLEMSQLSYIGVPTGHSAPTDQCLRCCFLKDPQAVGHQPGLQPPTVIPRNAVQGVPQPNALNAPPLNMYSGDVYRWQPETCQRCCSARVPHPTDVPDRAVASNAPHIAPTSYQLYDSLESVTLGGNAVGGGGGGGGNEYFVLDETSGKAERWSLLPAATYNFLPPQGAKGANMRSLSLDASELVELQPLNIPATAQGPFRLAPGPAGVQFPRQLGVSGMAQRTADRSAVYVRLPDPSALSPSDAEGPQLMRQAAMLGLSQRADTKPAVFVRLGPPADNAAPQRLLPQTSREAPPPSTIYGKLALEALQDVGSESRELQRRSSDFLKKYRKHLLRQDVQRQLPSYYGTELGDYQHLRHNQPPQERSARSSQQSTPMSVKAVQRPAAAYGNTSQAKSSAAGQPGRPRTVAQARGSVSVSTQTGRHTGKPSNDSQVESSRTATERVFMQGSLRSILPAWNEKSYSQGQRITEDFGSSDSSNDVT